MSRTGGAVGEGEDERGKYVFVAVIALAIVALDQITKLLIVSRLALHESVSVIPGWFELTYVRNTGAAFSMFAGHSASFRIPFFTVVALLAGAAILGFVRQTPSRQRWVLFSCAAVLGGAAGNLVDRLRSGDVIDFLLVHWREHYWPAFNVADSFITVGVLILVLRTLFVRDEPSEAPAADPPS